METRARDPEISDGAAATTPGWADPHPEGGTLREATLALLRAKCTRGSEDRPDRMNLRGIRLTGEDLSNLDLSHYDLTGADLTKANLAGTNLAFANLSEATLHRAVLDDCELLRADLAGADLTECEARRAGFGAANLDHASFMSANLHEATLSESSVQCADFRAAQLHGVSFRSSKLCHSTFIRADLTKADLEEGDLEGANFEHADMRGARLRVVHNSEAASWIGADIRDIDMRGAYMVRRFIMDQNYLYEFRNQSKASEYIYWLWWLTSDCGRSLARWSVFVLGVALLFAFAYSLVDVGWGEKHGPFAPFYFSVVTLTTLGYGDIAPVSTTAQALVIVEAVLGYVGLGGLLSILSNKMARRAD